jgi:hypothetical protein
MLSAPIEEGWDGRGGGRSASTNPAERGARAREKREGSMARTSGGKLRRFVGRSFKVLGLLLAVLIAASAVSNIGRPTASRVLDHLSPEERARAEEARHLRQSLGDTIWPGFGRADVPLLVYNERYAFLFGEETVPTGWERLDSGCSRCLWPKHVSFAVDVGGQWVGSMATQEWMRIGLSQEIAGSLPPGLRQVFPYRLVLRLFTSDWYIAGLEHECFHAYQAQRAPQRFAAAEAGIKECEQRYPWHQPAPVAAWRVEAALLVRAVEAPSEAEAARLAQAFLQQRARRRADTKLDPDLIYYEQRREWLEGLGKYVELTAWRQGATARGYEPLPAMAKDRGFGRYQGHARRRSYELAQLRRQVGRKGDNLFYQSGMAQGFLLDRLQPGWKERALTEKSPWLEDLVAAAAARPGAAR